MTAYYCFDYKGTLRDGIIYPSHAYNLMTSLRKTSLSDFCALGAVSVDLVGGTFGAVLMCGEKRELKLSLNNQTIQTISSDTDTFVIKYALLKTSSIPFAPPTIVICAAPILKWWRGNGVADCGTTYGWSTLYDHEFIGIKLTTLSKMVKNAKAVS
jgi:hypothetical protein